MVQEAFEFVSDVLFKYSSDHDVAEYSDLINEWILFMTFVFMFFIFAFILRFFWIMIWKMGFWFVNLGGRRR